MNYKEEWQKKKQRIINHHGNQCCLCGCTTHLFVQSLDCNNRFSNCYDDYEVLCWFCKHGTGNASKLDKEFREIVG